MSHFLQGVAARTRWRLVPVGPGAALKVARPSAAGRERTMAVEDPMLRAGLFGRLVIVGWEGVQVEAGELRWRPGVRPDGTLPYSPMNAALLYIRASDVRHAVDTCLARWDAELSRGNGNGD